MAATSHTLALTLLVGMSVAAALPTPIDHQTDLPYLAGVDDFAYDYSADVEAQEALIGEATTAASATPPRDPLADAREMARLNIMDRILIALGPPFGEKLPKAPTSDTLATVPTPINITTEPCPYKYKRCSSQTFFPSCDIPRNTASEIWPQRFNMFFNLTGDLDTKLDVINATLRLFKNNSLPLQRPKTLLIKAYVYTKSLTRRRNKTRLVADTQVSSDYIGWVTLSVTGMVKRWRKHKNNHGVLITVNDIDEIPWDAPRIFVTMDCASGLVPLPFEVQTEQEGQQYPALNVRLGSPDEEPEVPLSSPSPSQSPDTPTTLFMQADEPATFTPEYDQEDEAYQGTTHYDAHPPQHDTSLAQRRDLPRPTHAVPQPGLDLHHVFPSQGSDGLPPVASQQEDDLSRTRTHYSWAFLDTHTHAHAHDSPTQPHVETPSTAPIPVVTPQATPTLPRPVNHAIELEHTTREAPTTSRRPPEVSVRAPRRRGGPRDQRHRRRNRGGHHRRE